MSSFTPDPAYDETDLFPDDNQEAGENQAGGDPSGITDPNATPTKDPNQTMSVGDMLMEQLLQNLMDKMDASLSYQDQQMQKNKDAQREADTVRRKSGGA